MSNCSTSELLETLRQDDYELLVRLAQRYYVDDRTQEQVAHEFALSRQKTQRLLKRARQVGVVTVHIEAPAWLRLNLESRLRDAFGLSEAVVAVTQDSQTQRDGVAQRGAQYLERHLRNGNVVAVSHGRSVGAVARFFRPANRLDVTFVSAMGGSPRADAPTNPDAICRALAQGCGGQAESLYAPAYVESAEDRDRLLAQEGVSRTFNRAAAADVALVGIGGVDDDCTMVRSGCLGKEEVAQLRDQGAVGDVLGCYVDREGRPVASPHQDRLVALSVDDLRRIGTVVAVASEPEKPAAILGILRTGVVDVLVVDEGNARAVLDTVSSESPAGATAGRKMTAGRARPGEKQANQRSANNASRPADLAQIEGLAATVAGQEHPTRRSKHAGRDN